MINFSTFRTRPCSKAKLASAYIPGVSHRVAMRKFNEWLCHSPELLSKLEESGMNLQTRYLNLTQVDLIIKHLGEP